MPINFKIILCNKRIFYFLFFFYSLASYSQNISGIINIYTPVVLIDPCFITVQSSAGFKVNDTVLIIQMKGVDIDTSNTSTFGTINNYNDCGNYEINFIQAINGNDIVLKYSLLKTYTISGMVQLIRVPSYNNATITGTLTAQAWNVTTQTGGVLAFIDNGTTTFNANINVDGKGFQGTSMQTTYKWANCSPGFAEPQSSIEAPKGESVAILKNTYNKGRGAPANGGGGGATDNGGGGASNFGAGGSGGRDGWQVNTCSLRAIGGYSLNYSNALNKIFLGGAGGDSQRAEQGATNNMGVSGGGIVIIRANSINGNNQNIFAKGIDAPTTLQDGGAGGGAGGAVLIDCNNYTSTININTGGGKGGDATIYTAVRCSGGGGGGGGILWVSTPSISPSIVYSTLGGAVGVSQVPAQNGLVGMPGGSLTNLVIPQSNQQGGAVFINIKDSICAGNNYTLPNGNIVNTTGIYSDTINVIGGCDSIITVDLTVNTIINTFATATICSGNSYTLPGGNIVSSSGTYYDTIASSSNCDTVITTTLTVSPAPTSTANPNICIGSSYTLPGGTVVNTSGTYIDTVLTSSGCDSIITTNLNIIQTIVTNQNPTICANNSYTLPGGNSVNTTGTYNDTLPASGGCDSVIVTSLTVLPNSSSTQNPVICSNSSFTLPNGTIVNTTGNYSTTIISSNGCDSVITTNLTVNPMPIASTNPDTTITIGDSVNLIATGGGSYNWYPSIGLNSTTNSNIIATPSITTTYCVIVSSPNGCLDTACVTIKVEEIPCVLNENLGIPNAFSPNEDGLNDVFCLQGWDACIEEFRVNIYNRWGERVYISENPNFCWDGIFRGQKLDAQVFVYQIEARYINKEEKVVKNGNITLIR